MNRMIVSTVAVVLMGTTVQAQASTILNLNGVSNNIYNNPVTEYLDAGTYSVRPIGVSDGGAYNAWSPYSSFPAWWNVYYVSTPLLIARGIFLVEPDAQELVLYSTDLEALSHAETSIFTVSTRQIVDFGVYDSIFYDNRGGTSLLVSQVHAPIPEPSTLLVLGGALVGFSVGGLRRVNRGRFTR